MNAQRHMQNQQEDQTHHQQQNEESDMGEGEDDMYEMDQEAYNQLLAQMQANGQNINDLTEEQIAQL